MFKNRHIFPVIMNIHKQMQWPKLQAVTWALILGPECQWTGDGIATLSHRGFALWMQAWGSDYAHTALAACMPVSLNPPFLPLLELIKLLPAAADLSSGGLAVGKDGVVVDRAGLNLVNQWCHQCLELPSQAWHSPCSNSDLHQQNSWHGSEEVHRRPGSNKGVKQNWKLTNRLVQCLWCLPARLLRKSILFTSLFDCCFPRLLYCSLQSEWARDL